MSVRSKGELHQSKSSKRIPKRKRTRKSTTIKYTDSDLVISKIDNGSATSLAVICLGTQWSYPSMSTMNALQSILIEEVEVYYIDQDENPEYCEKNHIITGSPAIFLYYKRTPIHIIRRRQTDPMPYFSGPLNKDMYISLIEAAKQVVHEAPNVKSESLTITIDF